MSGTGDLAASAPAPSDPDGVGSRRSKKVVLGRYEVGRLLGCGAFAKVYHARSTTTGQSVALKVIPKHKLAGAAAAGSVLREICAMRRLRHPHVVRLHEVLATRSKIYLAMEYARGGELFDRLSVHGRLPEDSARLIFHQLVSAVAFCHSRGVFHRDLKPENLLLDAAGDQYHLKVSDFGLCAAAENLRPDDGLLHTLCGTPAYVAPEVLAKRGYHGDKVDIWSCGVILFVLAAGYLPFNDPNLMNLYRKIYRGEYRCPRWTSPELRRLISRLLDVDPRSRIGVDGILRDPWFRKGLDEPKMAAMIRDGDVEERIAKFDGGGSGENLINAFELISLAPGLDLSGLVGGPKPIRERFVVSGDEEAVLDRVEEVGEAEGLTVRRRGIAGGGRGGAAAVEGRDGVLVAWIEIYRFAPGMVMVELEIGGDGDSAIRWSGRFWREKMSTTTTMMMGSSEEGRTGSPVSEEADRPVRAGYHHHRSG